ncbi:MAG TPA: hypothetical protein EYN43_05030, partial [Gammaproteobacteria bacterium]|nr:hypothetical protein [Gammaproteobacteria bacterium]
MDGNLHACVRYGNVYQKEYPFEVVKGFGLVACCQRKHMSKLEKSVNAVDGPVAEDLVGEVWPSAEPAEDPVLYGHAVLEPRDPVEVRSLQTFHLTYTV